MSRYKSRGYISLLLEQDATIQEQVSLDFYGSADHSYLRMQRNVTLQVHKPVANSELSCEITRLPLGIALLFAVHLA